MMDLILSTSEETGLIFLSLLMMKKWSKEKIEKILDDAPKVSPSLINEIYEALEDGGVDGVNILFTTTGTFNPKFKDRTEVIRYIVIIKQLAGTLLTPEEQRVLKQARN